jgi:hypothetical protein
MLVPRLEQWMEERGKLRLLVLMHDFHGWDAGGLWADLKFDLHHFGDFDRIAFVGETKWQQYMIPFCRPFTGARIHYFNPGDIEKARAWLESQGGDFQPKQPK